MKSTTEKVALAIAIVIIIGIISAIVGGTILIVKLINVTKDSITGEKFVQIMEYNGFDVSEKKNEFLGPYIKLDKAYVAEKDDYEIEFYTFKNESSAEEFFDTQKRKLDSDTASTRVDFSGKNFQTFNIETSGKYKFLERVEKTVILVNVDKEYKSDIKDIVKEMGY